MIFAHILTKFSHTVHYFELSPLTVISPFHLIFLYMTADHSLEFQHSLYVPYFKNQFLIDSHLNCFQFFTIISYAEENSIAHASF